MFTNAEIHRDITPADYHAWNGDTPRGHRDYVVSRSDLMYMLDCGEMFLAGGTFPETDSLKLGDLVDTILLTPEDIDGKFAVTPETYLHKTEEKKWNRRAAFCKQWHLDNPEADEHPETYGGEAIEKPWNRNSATCKEWELEQQEAGRQVVSAKMFQQAQAIAIQVGRHDCRGITLAELIANSETQLVVTADWSDPVSGMTVPCRAMLDLARNLDGNSNPIAYDLKTAQDVSRYKFQRSIKSYGYDVQSWMYAEMLGAALGVDQVPFGFICVRNSRPWLVATYRAAECKADGEERFRRAMSDYIDGLENGFRGYTEGFEAI